MIQVSLEPTPVKAIEIVHNFDRMIPQLYTTTSQRGASIKTKTKTLFRNTFRYINSFIYIKKLLEKGKWGTGEWG
jgi:hypothetical protein